VLECKAYTLDVRSKRTVTKYIPRVLVSFIKCTALPHRGTHIITPCPKAVQVDLTILVGETGAKWSAQRLSGDSNGECCASRE